MKPFLLLCLFTLVLPPAALAQLKLATFDVDATPARGSQLTYDPMKEAGELTLRCRGIVLTGMEKPVVLCALDWIGISNTAHDAFCEALADAAGTVPVPWPLLRRISDAEKSAIGASC